MNFELGRSIPVLERTPAVLREWLRGLPDEWLLSAEGPDTFGPFDVVGHLIDGEETDWIPRARIILSAAAERKFQPYDRFRHYERNRDRPLEDLLLEFASLRRKNLDTLRGFDLQPADLRRTGTHPEFGSVTLEQLLATWVAHDLGHIGQIARVMAKQYSQAVGPWHKYLPILHPRHPSNQAQPGHEQESP